MYATKLRVSCVTPNMESNQYTYWPLPNMLKWAYASIAFNLLLTFCQ